jgi:hypothetical protein
VEVNNPLTRQRLGMSREALLELIAMSMRGPSPTGTVIADHFKQVGLLASAEPDEAIHSGIARWLATTGPRLLTSTFGRAGGNLPTAAEILKRFGTGS